MNTGLITTTETNTAPAITPPPKAMLSPLAPSSATRINRWLAGVSGGVLAVILAINIPVMLRMPFDCDVVLYDVFARNMADGQLLYRDMLDNRPPTMTLIHAVFRTLFGGSIEALRIFDLLIVGTAITLLARFTHPGRWDWQLLTGTVLTAFYCSTNELCHAQGDVWLCTPLLAALTLRRAQLARLISGRSRISITILEGFIWGCAVWIKPHMMAVAAVVWLTGAAWCWLLGTRLTTLLRDIIPLLIGGLACGAIGVAVMLKLGIWDLYIAHVRTWVGEYYDADFYRPFGIWVYRLFYLWFNRPWAIVYLFALPVAAVQIVTLFRSGKRTSSTDDEVASPEHRLLLATALLAWGIQAWGVQHMFDYVHLGGVLLAWAYLFQLVRTQPTTARCAVLAVFFVGLAAVTHASVLRDRVLLLSRCVSTPTTELRQDLNLYHRMNWVALEAVSEFLQSQNVRQDEVTILADTALPVWLQIGLKQPTRYYLFHNNLLSYQSRRDEILGSFAANAKQRFVVIDIRLLRRIPPEGGDWDHPATWPLTSEWRSPRDWESRIVFRREQYIVVEITGPEVPQFVNDLVD